MTKYRIHASYTAYCYLDVDADSQDDALEIGMTADGGDFKQTDLGDWNIDFVKEVTE
jgi:hypothetical protein